MKPRRERPNKGKTEMHLPCTCDVGVHCASYGKNPNGHQLTCPRWGTDLPHRRDEAPIE